MVLRQNGSPSPIPLNPPFTCLLESGLISGKRGTTSYSVRHYFGGPNPDKANGRVSLTLDYTVKSLLQFVLLCQRPRPALDMGLPIFHCFLHLLVSPHNGSARMFKKRFLS